MYYLADYSASKAAIINLSESLRYELDKRLVGFHFETECLLTYNTL